ncbi:uncharacterized protein LOC108604909, partial [Drosophila busckii]|uniref:uncharacterized protein LOC108604909 n=1 Tax=Drosophila busckii TaxID=30019 RepID=UPI00083E9DA5
SNSNSSNNSKSVWPSPSQSRPICDDFAEQPRQLLEHSTGYHSSSSSSHNSPQRQQLRRTQDMAEQSCTSDCSLQQAVGNLEWEMFMLQHAQSFMPKTSSPIGQRRRDWQADLNSRSYHKWRHYLQSTPAHMLHNVSRIPEAIAGQFCPRDFPAFSDLEEMESAAKRYKVDPQLTQLISTDL